MDIKIYRVATLLFVALTTIFSTCKKGGIGCANTIYNFRIGAILHPDLDSVHIGDTIWIDVNTPSSLADLATNQIIDFSRAANLGSAISIVKFVGGSISDPGAIYSANSFDYILIFGKQLNNPFAEGIREYTFTENNKMYNFKLAIIPKQLGIFAIGLSNAVNVYRKSDNCTKAGFEIDFINTDQHLYYLQNNRPGYIISGAELTSLYCFKVY